MKASPTFVCPECDKLKARCEQVERRIEFRDTTTQARRGTYCQSKICRGYADAELDEHRERRGWAANSDAVEAVNRS